MATQVFQSIKEAIASLNPEEIERHAERPLRLFLYAHSDPDYQRMEDFLAPPELSDAKRAELRHRIHRASEGFSPVGSYDLEIYIDDSPRDQLTPTQDVFGFQPGAPARLIDDLLKRRPDLAIPLAIHLLPFRAEVSRRIVKKVARENALFALATAVPDIIPFVSLPWAVGEFASDTAVLTANQIRMAFLLAAASDREFGYREQKGEIASIILGAFGWRAMARELAGKIPLGGGLIPKAAIAYAGTRVVGLSLERFYRLGYGFTRDERRSAYENALERGREVASSLLNGLQRNRPEQA
ncbi:MAG TPA: hypothetical protein VEV17_25865 [Bryobacteraceae bacterium]|nr:hypothetical protein [Bryobacteraceae bacterium]